MIVPGIRFVQGKNNYSDVDGAKFGIGIHNTSNDASDEGEASYATWRPDGTSSHLYVDDDSVTQSLDTARKAGHAGSSQGNENAIAVEITGGNGMSRSWWLANVAWDKLGAVLATIIRHHWPDGSFQVRRASVAEMKANPKVKAFYGHDDMRLAWGGTTHTDPGPNFPWDHLLAMVRAELGGTDVDPKDINAIRYTDARVEALTQLRTAEAFGPSQGNPVPVVALLNKLADDVAAIKDRGPAAPAPADVAAIKAALLDPEVLGALADVIFTREAAADRARADVLDAGA